MPGLQHDFQASRSPRSQGAAQQILAAAEDVFGKQGYRQGSLRDVADAVGLSVQGVLHYFSTKEELLFETLERRNVSRADWLLELRRDRGAVGAMRSVLQENLEHPGFMRMFVTLAAEATDPEHPARGYFEMRYRTSFENFSADFVKDQETGRAPAGVEPSTAARTLISLADGLQLQFLMQPGLDLLTEYDKATAHLR